MLRGSRSPLKAWPCSMRATARVPSSLKRQDVILAAAAARAASLRVPLTHSPSQPALAARRPRPPGQDRRSYIPNEHSGFSQSLISHGKRHQKGR